jgi:hypothetical protein
MKRTFGLSAMFLSVVVVSLAVAAVLAVAQSGLQHAIVVDQYGALVGQVAGSGISVDSTNTASVPVVTRTAAPTGVTMSTLAPAFTPTPTTVTVKVPASVPIGFCVSGDYYNKSTGLCADGKMPYKIVPVGSLSNSKAQTPTVACTAPKVATFNSSTSAWSCLVPPGYKVNM